MEKERWESVKVEQWPVDCESVRWEGACGARVSESLLCSNLRVAR
jgi:uncharacterized protein YqjF (DUF2071 family)